MLANRSPVFSAMFQIAMKEKRGNIVEIEDLSAVAVEGMLSFIYTNKVLIDIDTVADLLKASDKYEIIDLKNFCGQFLAGALDIQNCVRIISNAELFNKQELKVSAINFIVSKNEEIYQMEDTHESAESQTDLYMGITKSCFKFLHMMRDYSGLGLVNSK
ncbi:hypothetical protein TKK_0005369 [Trichogramma kaykai]|uniref:BTB domain-containing protein n=1 Tax=Trichogramma kaykai TaxID=54128 RepID=A0ABD2XIL3_9HYME